MSEPPSVRSHLALALDVADADEAAELARRHGEVFGVAKVGLELFTAVGPTIVEVLRGQGMKVFCDLKLHDIPTTVSRATWALGRLGVAYTTLHAAGGVEMLRAGVEGLAGGAREAGYPTPSALGVTVLTSDPDPSGFDELLSIAASGGCAGVVCSTGEIARVRHAYPELLVVVAGIRLAGTDSHDQARVGTPQQAVLAGADLLVVGRTVTAAPDPDAAAAMIAEAVRSAFE